MRFLEQSHEILEQFTNINEASSKDEILDSIFRHIELAGRTCYKSMDKITTDSAKPFVERLERSKHYAMLEHGTVYLYIEVDSPLVDKDYLSKADIVLNYIKNPYSKVKRVDNQTMTGYYAFITTNYRVIKENGWEEDLKYICAPRKEHYKRHCVKVITNLQVSHEIVRHRKFSYAMESSRYCNYSKDKFGKELTFIMPSWNMSFGMHSQFIKCLGEIEKTYFAAIEDGWKPQEAATFLPKATKTEIIISGFESDWDFFFRLRSDIAETGKPHPQMEELVNPIRDEFFALGWTRIEKQ